MLMVLMQFTGVRKYQPSLKSMKIKSSILSANSKKCFFSWFRKLLSVCLFTFIISVSLYAQVKRDKKINKAFISFRIGTELYLTDERYNELINLFDKYKEVTDEIAFFTSETHPPLPLEVFKDRMQLLKKRMQIARQHGYRSGINILSTIGHHEENLDNSLKGDYTNMTDIDGRICKGSFCPNDENFREYIRQVYTSMTQAEPDYIWIDDDIRLAGHLPVYLTCFCQQCLNIFEKEYGKKFSRESLKKEINEGSDKSGIRNAWLQHNRNTIANLFKLIEQTVHAIKPGLPLGFMTGDRFFEGYDFDNWAKVLAGKNNAPVLWRPGGGFYQDDVPGQMAGKSHDIGRQVSVLPKNVISIQSEIENYTYQRLKKSAHITGLEAASHIASGCTGVAFNVLPMNNEPLSQYEPLIKKLHQLRPFYDLMVSELGRSAIDGVSSFWNKNSFVGAQLEEGSWFSSGVGLAGYELDEIGLPTTYSTEKAKVIKLNKGNVLALSNDEIKKILSGGVYMDAEALTELNNRGFHEFTGFSVSHSSQWDRIEKLSEHPLNGSFSGMERDNRQAVYRSNAFALKKTSSKSEILSGLMNYAEELVDDCTMGIFENSLGGRVCIAGYYPWNAVHTLSKSTQIKAVFRWLSGDLLPGYIKSYHKVNLWIREPQNGKTALAFTNASFDGAENIELMLRTTSDKIKVYDMKCNEMVVKSAGADGPYKLFIIPFVDPWQMRLVTTE